MGSGAGEAAVQGPLGRTRRASLLLQMPERRMPATRGGARGISVCSRPAMTQSCPHPRPAQPPSSCPSSSDEHHSGWWPMPRPLWCSGQVLTCCRQAQPPPVPHPTPDPACRKEKLAAGLRVAPAWLCRTTFSDRQGPSTGHPCALPGCPSLRSARLHPAPSATCCPASHRLPAISKVLPTNGQSLIPLPGLKK